MRVSGRAPGNDLCEMIELPPEVHPWFVMSARNGEGKLTIIDTLTLAEAKTKRMIEALAGLGIAGSVLVVLPGVDETVERAARNLPTVRVCTTEALTPYEILRHANLVVTRDALQLLAARLGEEVA